MALQRVREYLKNFNMDSRIIELGESSSTVCEAAHALGTTESQIAKTLSFYVGEIPILVVVRGDAKIDNSKFKHTFGCKCHMIPADEVEEAIGHAPGGVCPFGVNKNVNVYLDESLKEFATVFPAAGSSNSAIEMTIDELEKTSNYVSWIDVSKVV